MEAKLDSRQGQFPASFPDTFKDFFAMMSEDEDQIDLFSNLLEDKVIPRGNRSNQRRCGGSLRCPSTSNNNVGRSNSFRVNRPKINNYCKHIKYCCLHQKQYSQNFIDFGYSSPSNDDEETNNGMISNCCGDGSSSGGKKQKVKSRHSLVEQTFDCDGCEESDTISTTSSTTIPYTNISRHHHQHHSQQQLNPHHPIQKQQHQQHRYSSHQKQKMKKENDNTDDNDVKEQHQNQKQSQNNKDMIIDNTTASCSNEIFGGSIGGTVNNSGKGYHSKDTLPRILQQQTGLRESVSGSKSLGSSLTVGRTNITEIKDYGINASINNSNVNYMGVRRSINTLYGDMNVNSVTLTEGGPMTKCLSDKLTPCPTSRPNTLRGPKSPVLNRRRSSSIAASLLTSDNKIFRNSEDAVLWGNTIPHSNTRERLTSLHSAKSTKGTATTVSSGVLSLKQAMSGAVSPQFSPSSSAINLTTITTGNHAAITPTLSTLTAPMTSFKQIGGGGCDNFLNGGSIAAIPTQINTTKTTKQRLRTSSMPAENRKPRLVDTRRQAIHCADPDFYRLRSFSITSHGVCNLGDSMRSRRSRSINSVTSTGTSNSGRDRHNSNASGDIDIENEGDCGAGGIVSNSSGVGGSSSGNVPSYKIAILGASGVGKTALTYQFTTSDYICAYDLSLDDDYGQKTVSVLLDGVETDLEIIDHPACEMSTEAFCSTYNIDLFVVIYSVVDRNTFKTAEKILHYLKDSEMLLTRGAILVGNKTDLERHREVTRQTGRRLAKEICCKFIETSSGLDHNVNELLVGIVAQVKLNPQRIHNLTEKEKQRVVLQNTLQQHRHFEFPSKKIMKQKSLSCKDYDSTTTITSSTNSTKTTSASAPSTKSTGSAVTKLNLLLSGPTNTISTTSLKPETNISTVHKSKKSKRALNLENILKAGESEIDDEDDDGYKPDFLKRQQRNINKLFLDVSDSSKTDDEIDNSDDDDDNNDDSDDEQFFKLTKTISSSPSKLRNSYEIVNQKQNLQIQKNLKQNIPKKLSTNLIDDSVTTNTGKESSSNQSSKAKSLTKFSTRTRIFLTSVLKFKKNLNVKRRNSSSCSDLFVI